MHSPTLVNARANTPARHWRDDLDQRTGGFSLLAPREDDQAAAVGGTGDLELDVILRALDA